ncbi:BrnT family toxin [Lachnospiraceae bacterium MD335]|nr:BrnT family toxin [Lachnospiraceae bacterium MD335]
MIIEMFDFEHSVEEDRYIAIGKVGDVLFVVFTERKDTIRLISARLATNVERGLYYDQDIHY